MEIEATIDRIKAAVGPRGWIADPRDQEPYLVEARGLYRGATRLVVRPASTAAVAAVVRICAEAKLPIVPQGGNTGLVGGGVPPEDGHNIVVALGRMNHIRAIDPINFTMTVEAGCILTDLQQAAAEADRLFPLSLGAEGSCQIGGNLSTNAGGIAVLRYGNTRELTLGLEVVLPDGRIWDGLRALRKDNTGYDLKQLFIGAEGTLGVVTAAVLKLYPAPRVRVTAFAAVPDVASAVRLLRDARATLGDRITGFELMSALSIAISRKHHPTVPNPCPGHPWYALIQADDSAIDSPVAAQVEQALAAAIESSVAIDATIAQSVDQAHALWALRENIAEAQRREGPNIKHDISLPVSAIPRFIDEAREALTAALSGVRFVTFGHLGDGNLHYNLAGPEGTDQAAFMANAPRANRIVHDLVATHGGSISAEHGIGQLKRDELARYKSMTELDLMRSVKAALDPSGIFNPGKVL